MKNYLYLIFLVFAVFLMDKLAYVILSSASDFSNIRYSKLYKGSINADILFVGNSRALSTFHSPTWNKMTDLKSFNLAYNGLTLPIVKIFLEDYLQHNIPPKMVFIEISCFDPSYDPIVNFKQYQNLSRNISSRLKHNFSRIYYSSLIFKSFRFNSEYFLRTLYYLYHNDQDWINKYTIRQAQFDDLANYDMPGYFNIESDSTINMFNNLHKYLEEFNITIFPVLSPIIHKCRDDFKKDIYLADIERRTGLSVLDYSSIFNEKDYFADAIHINQKGSYALASELINHCLK